MTVIDVSTLLGGKPIPMSGTFFTGYTELLSLAIEYYKQVFQILISEFQNMNSLSRYDRAEGSRLRSG